MLNLAEAPVRLIAERFAPESPSNRSPEPQILSLAERIASLQEHRTKRGGKTMLSLSEAATAAGSRLVHPCQVAVGAPYTRSGAVQSRHR